MKKLKPSVALLETKHKHSKKMSQYSCVDLSQVTEAEQKEAMGQLLASAKLYKARQVLIESARQMKISFDEEHAKKNANREFTLCQRCVMASPEEQVPEPDAQ
jgi:hypothetical protein